MTKAHVDACKGVTSKALPIVLQVEIKICLK